MNSIDGQRLASLPLGNYCSCLTDKNPVLCRLEKQLEDIKCFDHCHVSGCIDPSEPFQCPESEKCISLQFICDGHPGDCPGNRDENEETCIAGNTNNVNH